MPAKELSTLIRLSRANYSLNFPCFANAVTKVWDTFVSAVSGEDSKIRSTVRLFYFRGFAKAKLRLRVKKHSLGFFHSRNVELLR